jgi:hypothetical protein
MRLPSGSTTSFTRTLRKTRTNGRSRSQPYPESTKLWHPQTPELESDGRNAASPPKLFTEGHRQKNKSPLTKAEALECVRRQQQRYAALAAKKPAKGADGQPRSLKDWADDDIIYGRTHLQLRSDVAQTCTDSIERIVDADPESKAKAFKQAKSMTRSANGVAGRRALLLESAKPEHLSTPRGGDYVMPAGEHYDKLSELCGEMAVVISGIIERAKDLAA